MLAELHLCRPACSNQYDISAAYTRAPSLSSPQPLGHSTNTPFQKKPYSAVTVTIETLTSEAYQEEDVGGIPDLVEVITIQASGPTEAARAIRKKLKYGNVHRQIRALVLLDGLIQNAGPRFQRTFADEPLLERLRVCGTSDLSDPEVRKKCRELFSSWSQYSNKPGLERIARLHKELPKRKIGVTQERSKVLKETENPFGDEEDDEPSSPKPSNAAGPSSSHNREPHSREGSVVNSLKHQQKSSLSLSGGGSIFGSSSSSSDKKKKSSGSKSKGKRKPFDLEAEKEQMKSVIAESSLAATNLGNVLQTINREKERISENNLAVERFESCKLLRRKVLRYVCHHQISSLLLFQSLLLFEDKYNLSCLFTKLTVRNRFITSITNSGSALSSTPTMNWSTLS